MQHPDVPKDAAVARPSPTFDDVDQSLDLFRESRVSSRSPLSLVSLWSGTPVLLRYVSELGLQQRSEKEISGSISQLQSALNDVCDPGQPLTIGDGVLSSSFAVFQERGQAALLAKGLYHAVRAVVGTDQQTGIGLRAWNSQRQDFAAAFADLKLTFKAYHSAWRLHGEPISGLVRERIATPTDDVATAILDEFAVAQNLNDGTEWCTTTNWLIVRRLLSYLLTPAANPETRGHENCMRLLAAERVDREGESNGTVLTATTQAYQEGHGSLYLDPVTSGLMTIDYDLRTCLLIADQIISGERSRDTSLRETSLRIGWPAETTLPYDLNGDSGGGLLVVSAVATSRKVGLDAGATASFAIQLKSFRQTTQPRLEDYCIAPVGGIRAKLTNNPQLGSIQRVHLCAGQTLDSHGTAWDDWVPTVARDTGLTILPVGTGDPQSDDIRVSLDKLIHEMTGDHQIELVLGRYSDREAMTWAAQCADSNDVDFLQHYMPPSFLKKVRDGKVLDQSEIENLRRKGEEIKEPYEPVSVDGVDEDTRFRDLFALGRRLIVTEDAGAGKSIFTRRGVAWCSEPQGQAALFDSRPGIAYRFERVDSDWPTSRDEYRHSLEQSVRPFCGDDTTAEKVIEYALKHGRVVLFCDALDQLTGDDAAKKLTAFHQFVAHIKASYPMTRVIVTSRAFAYESQKLKFPIQEWQLCRLTGFSPIVQCQYLADIFEEYDLLSESQSLQWRVWQTDRTVPSSGRRHNTPLTENEFADEILGSPEVFGNLYSSIRELLQVPAILAFVRTLCSQTGGFPRFANRADLYFQANEHLLERNLEKREELAWEIRNRKSELREILSAIAFQMMVNDSQNYVVQGQSAVEKLQKHVRLLISTESIQNDWNHLWQLVEQLAGFTSHLVVERKSHDYFGWKHRGMMEFYCGLFLAKNSVSRWPGGILKDGSSFHLSDLLANPQWDWAVRFCIQVTEALDPDAREWHDPQVLCQTMATLFLFPTHHPRPTEHMFHAWQLMKRDPQRYPGLEATLRSYRQQFLDILSGKAAIPSMMLSKGAEMPTPLNRAQRAAEVITERDLWKHVQAGRTGTFSFRDLRPDYVEQLAPLLGKQNAAEVTDADIGEWFEREGDQLPPHLRPAHSTYALCSNATSSSPWAKPSTDKDQLTFLMGASPEDTSADDDEKYDASDKKRWWIEQSIPAFQMATCCVTRAQYRQFDPHLEHFPKSSSAIRLN